ncbi:putative RNA-directed DNA polymerase, eukaryota, reverse transcriptase zinc-binding domain protein [Tanacetum coccineum]
MLIVILDHRLILLKDFKVDFGPTHFRFFHFWLELDVCNDLVVQTWTHDGIVEASGFISFKKKLKNLKWVIRDWVISKKANSNKLKREHQSRLASINAKVDQGKRFQRFNGIQPTLNVDMPNMLSPTQRDSLDIQFSHDEIKRAVWDCGGDRAPGPDGFTFKFIMSFWDLIKDDVARFVNEFFFTSLIPKGCTSSFIALIPKVSNARFINDFRPISLIGFQYKIIGKLLANRLGSFIGICNSFEQSAFIKGRNILDGPLILNEVMAWYHKRKKELMVFKVDFEKAFDSLRGSRQGDPLYPFLFILAMEGLHMLTHKAEAMCIFKGVILGNDNMRISHLIYADDVIFIGDWSYFNAHNLLCMLRCFYLISSLEINVNKSNILGLGVPETIVSNMDYSIGCRAASFPMKYLGVPVGGNMALCYNRKAITQTFSSKLALWKACLSVGGRLSLIKSVLVHLQTYYMSIYPMPSTIAKKLKSMCNQFFSGGDIDERKMSWVHWNKCLASKDLRSLGIVRSSQAFIGLMEASIILLLVALATSFGEMDIEMINHIFFSCDMALDLWAKLARWWDLDISICANIFKWFDWIGTLQLSNKVKDYLEGVGGT